jgi:hypothetical protein
VQAQFDYLMIQVEKITNDLDSLISKI